MTTIPVTGLTSASPEPFLPEQPSGDPHFAELLQGYDEPPSRVDLPVAVSKQESSRIERDQAQETHQEEEITAEPPERPDPQPVAAAPAQPTQAEQATQAANMVDVSAQAQSQIEAEGASQLSLQKVWSAVTNQAQPKASQVMGAQIDTGLAPASSTSLSLMDPAQMVPSGTLPVTTLELPEGVQIAWNSELTPEPVGVVEQSTWQVWASRLQEGASTPAAALPVVALTPEEAVQPTPQVITATTAQAPTAAMITAQSGAGGQTSTGSGSGQEPSASTQTLLEPSAATADVQGGATQASTSASSTSRPARVVAAIREHLGKTDQAGKVSTANLDVRIGEERLTIVVTVRDGQVEVQVKGFTEAELSQLRQDLEPELERQSLDLGDLSQFEQAPQDHGDAQEQLAAPAPTVKAARDSVSSLLARTSAQTQEPGLHIKA